MMQAGVLLVLLLVAAVSAQQECTCDSYGYDGLVSCTGTPPNCTCHFQLGPDTPVVNCKKLLPKCLLMKKESIGKKAGRRPKHDFLVVDNDGLYNPDCEADGIFKARQCNGTDTCWCVNSAGVRRTDKMDKSDKNLKCDRLVRTFWVVVQMKLNGSAPENDVAEAAFKDALAKTIVDRYKLPAKHISLELEGTYVYVDLKQNKSEMAPTDPDIADVAYYIEKDIKGISLLPPESQFDIVVNGKSVGVKEPLISYIDSERPQLSMKHLSGGVIAVVVVVLLAIVAGIVVLVLTRRKRGQYQKAEVKEMGEMQLTS
ncbi:epithelial cell adhesion molecule [Ambystoma mexicanum]|uniref:epithelial cell adhesion molecule n=1 Tax=Ambystoma mexicanum TaxID=8296 RepID=UPI0037E8D63D